MIIRFKLLRPKYIGAICKFEPYEPSPVAVLETPAGAPHPTLIFEERENEHTDKPQFIFSDTNTARSTV